MTELLPEYTNIKVNSVFYNYTTVKSPEDPMTVAVQNKNADGTGYIFREVDDWTGLPGNTINKVVRLGEVPITAFGEGSIEVTGVGEVVDPSVVFAYSYEDAPEEAIEVPDIPMPSDEEYIQAILDEKVELEEEEQENEESQEEKERLEILLGGTNALAAGAEAKALELFAMSIMPPTYYTVMAGGKYNETIQYTSNKLPSNPEGLRVGLAQQVLHEKMVDEQYHLGEN